MQQPDRMTIPSLSGCFAETGRFLNMAFEEMKCVTVLAPIPPMWIEKIVSADQLERTLTNPAPVRFAFALHFHLVPNRGMLG
ncbi:hypothetical protein GCM10028804_27220 [Larkinella terrae]